MTLAVFGRIEAAVEALSPDSGVGLFLHGYAPDVIAALGDQARRRGYHVGKSATNGGLVISWPSRGGGTTHSVYLVP